jgi:predicted nucleic acid-binding protein
MTLVVDASIAVRWLFPVANDATADDLARSEAPIIAPDLIIAEIVNAAWKFARFHGHEPAALASIIAAADKAFDELVPCSSLRERAFQIAVELQHPAHDCFYLALAEQRDCHMVTADERLIARCARSPFGKLVKSITARSGRRR